MAHPSTTGSWRSPALLSSISSGQAPQCSSAPDQDHPSERCASSINFEVDWRFKSGCMATITVLPQEEFPTAQTIHVYDNQATPRWIPLERWLLRTFMKDKDIVDRYIYEFQSARWASFPKKCPPSKTCHLLKLPQELHDQIYSYIIPFEDVAYHEWQSHELLNSHDISNWLEKSNWPVERELECADYESHPRLPVLLVNRQIREEVKYIIHSLEHKTCLNLKVAR